MFQGESIREVARLNPNPDARFFGFDSFEGLPQIEDPRVSFVPGWFDQSLPPFLLQYRPQDRLWIHIDADLYGSTLCALTYLNRHIRTGTIMVFDEVEDLMHEFKALCDFQDMSGKTLELFAASQNCRHAAFVCRD